MSTTTAAISIDRFRRRRASASAAASDALGTASAHPLVGFVLGSIERRYGLMRCEETIAVAEVISTSGDLAVADRLAFVASMERGAPVLVIEFDGWYVACATERALAPDEVAALRSAEDAPRVMSIVSERGITPALGPLSA